MPELPEVETTLRGLEKHLHLKSIEQVLVRRRDLRWPIADSFEEVIVNQSITSFRRKGKYLILDLKNGISILGHLGMSGTFRVEPKMPDDLRKHDHLVIIFESGEVAIYHDPRRFGFILLCHTKDLSQHPRLKNMGPDPIESTELSTCYFEKALKKRSGMIKPALLDQKLIAGVGNIYACEALYEARIHPKRQANSLKGKEIERLIESIRAVMQSAIASGGSTLKDFSGASGQSGYFQHAFKVYNRAQETCMSCNLLLSVENLAGRSTFFCKKCQK